MYDVKQERVVFLVENQGEVVSATGRAYGNFQPKWFKYSKSEVPFITGNNREIAIIVEDCVSACAIEVKCGFTGIALMGTSLQESFIEHITNSASNVVICLDRDATDKCFDMKNKLESKVNAYIWMIDEDLKSFSDDKMKEWKGKICRMIL
jgi:DNA primase